MAKRRYERIELNGKTFTFDKKVKVPYPSCFTSRGVHDVYERCSDAKSQIWCDWSNWFYDNKGFCRVASYNCNFFTIEGKVEDKITKKKYWCYITYANQYCYELV